MKNFILIVLLHISVLLNAQITVVADSADNTITNIGSSDGGVNHFDSRINFNKSQCFVIPFEIPHLDGNQRIMSASFSFYLKSVVSGGGTTPDIDLYGLDFRHSSTVDLTNDFFVGDNDNKSDKLQDAIITINSQNGTINTSNETNVKLLNYINSQIDKGAKEGDFIFLRLNPNLTGSYKTWYVSTANSTSNKPKLTLTVGSSNKPKFNSKIEDQIVNEGSLVVMDISATDSNSKKLTFTTQNSPSFASLVQNTNETAQIYINPKEGDSGTYSNIVVTVSNGNETDEQTFSITVKNPNVNTPPVISPIANITIEEHKTKKIHISVSDFEDDYIDISIKNKPSFLVLSKLSNGEAELVISPSSGDMGIYRKIEIIANDGKSSISEFFNIEITEKQVVEGKSYYCDPVNGSMSNDGSIDHPWSKLEDVFARSKKFEPGDYIFLMSGAHGKIYINGANSGNGTSDAYITIKAKDGETPYISSVQLESGSFYAFNEVTFTSDGRGGNTFRGYMLSTNKNFTNLKVVNCNFNSGDDSSSWSKADWYSHAKDAVMIKGDHLIFNYNTIRNTYFAFQMEANYAEVKNNVIDNFGADAIRALGSHAIYEGNLIRDSYIEDYGVNHDDGIQIYCRANIAGGLVEDVIIRNNKIYTFKDPITQAMKDDKLIGYSMQGIMHTDSRVENVIIENNLVVSDHYHGITLASAKNSRIQNNTVVKTPNSVNPDLKAIPWIQIRDAKGVGEPTGNIVRNNICYKVTKWTFDQTKNLTENNIESSISGFNDLFTNYNNFDLTLKKGSIAIDAGINKDLFSTDIDGNIRVVGSKVDCGAYEYQTNPNLGEEESDFDGVLIYPNPVADNSFTVKLNGNLSIKHIRLFRIDGLEVLNLTTNKNILKVQLPNGLASGVYIVTVNNIFRRRVVIKN